MSQSQFLSARSQAGQAVVLIALMLLVIFGAVGLAVDGGIAYYYNASAERAAAAAALSGVIFMPAQYAPGSDIPAGSGNDATDRAWAAAARNNFDHNISPNPNNITVSVNPVAGADNKLSVTVSRTVQTFFMQVFGISTITISRTAIATYLPPLKLGQPGGQVGSTIGQLGNGGYYFMRTEGWRTDRGQGDAYTPGRNTGGCGPACPSNDAHQISANQGTDLADPTLPWDGGYNFMITVPAGSTARVQVYNAAFAPDSSVGGPNYCENWNTTIGAYSGPNPCANKATSTNYFFHEDDCCSWGNTTSSSYSAMKYTIFTAPSVFIRSTDTPISQMLVKPIDASCWGGPNAVGDSAICTGASPAPYNFTGPGYRDMNTGAAIQQKYNALTGAPQNMFAYHAWMDVGSYIPDNTCIGPCGGQFEAEQSIISYIRGPLAGPLGAGTYRLRIDTLEANGGNPCNNNGTICNGQSYAHKGFAVRVTDAGGVNPCANCTASALDDMSIFTPINANNASFPLPIFQLPPDYAGQTVSVDIFDAGDMGGTGSIYLGFIDPTTGGLLVEPAGNPPGLVYDLGNQRSNYPASATLIGSYSNPNPVEQVVNAGGSAVGDNKWYHFEIPIPSTYNPGANPANWWWKLNYRTTTNVRANDTITITLNLKGNPAHLLQS